MLHYLFAISYKLGAFRDFKETLDRPIIYQDDFTDLSKLYRLQPNWGDSYSDKNFKFSPDNVRVEDSKLIISTGYNSNMKCNTTGWVDTENFFKFSKGRVDIKMKVYPVQHQFSALWTLANENTVSNYSSKVGTINPEFDIVEISEHPSKHLHPYWSLWYKYNPRAGSSKNTTSILLPKKRPIFNITDKTSWVKYSLEITDNEVTWFVNDQPVRITNDRRALLHKNNYIIMSNGITTQYQDLELDLVDVMEIDWIKVYK